ncbi:phosphoenolpyruvate mutase [Nocardia terpenica]|nr:phosphoenolpyruvate mutase [Nocardia terpenica]
MPTYSTTNDLRRARLSGLLSERGCIRVIEAHNPISAIVAEGAHVSASGPFSGEFDAIWSSSLTDSAVRGLPDIEILDWRIRLAAIDEIFAVTAKPLIMDGDTGGLPEHFEYTVRELERRGVSAVIIEDKRGLKQNSLLGGSRLQEMESMERFCDKIRRGKATQVTQEFQIFARIESLILGEGMHSALQRADEYVNAGSDGIMIHSRDKCPDDVMKFATEFRKTHPGVTLIAVPTTYNSVHADELAGAGFNIVIYANHLFRSSMKAMQDACRRILLNGRTAEVEEICVDLAEILNLARPVMPTADRLSAVRTGELENIDSYRHTL